MLKEISKAGSTAIVSTRGGTVTGFNIGKTPIIFPEMQVGDKSRGGIPVCFPFFGSPKPEFAEFGRHGWLRHQELDVLRHTSSCLVLQGENERTKSYPWQLRYRIVVTVDCSGSLLLELEITRLIDGQYYLAPINPGFHPYFVSNQNKGRAIVGKDLITNFPSKANFMAAQASIGIMSGKRTIQVLLPEGFNPDSLLTLWSDNTKKYFCVEPVLGSPAKFNSRGGKFLKENERFRMSMYIQVF